MTTFTFPDIHPDQLDWHLMPNVQQFRSPLTAKTQTIEMPGAAWVIRARFSQLKRAEMAELEAFIARQRGGVHTFTWHHLGQPTPRGSAPGAPLVNGASQTGTTLTTDGWTVSQADILLPGDLFAVNGELKRIVEAVDSDASGEATLTFEPPLRTAPADNVALTTTNPTTTFALLDGVQGKPSQRGPLAELSLQARETW